MSTVRLLRRPPGGQWPWSSAVPVHPAASPSGLRHRQCPGRLGHICRTFRRPPSTRDVARPFVQDYFDPAGAVWPSRAAHLRRRSTASGPPTGIFGPSRPVVTWSTFDYNRRGRARFGCRLAARRSAAPVGPAGHRRRRRQAAVRTQSRVSRFPKAGVRVRSATPGRRRQQSVATFPWPPPRRSA